MSTDCSRGLHRSLSVDIRGCLAGLGTVGVFFLSVGSVWADPVEWRFDAGGNGHFYDIIDATGITWTDARSAAEGMSYLGVSGHLAAITSADEQAFIVANFAPGNEVGYRWLGGFQDEGSPEFAEPAGGWRWITGEPWSFTAWHPGEPNNSNPDHDFLRTWGSGPAEWEDFRDAGGEDTSLGASSLSTLSDASAMSMEISPLDSMISTSSWEHGDGPSVRWDTSKKQTSTAVV